MKKTIILNASPRKNWNTAQVLKSAMEGAKSVSAEVKYIDLYDLNFTGCRGCMACKRKDAERCRCYWKDDLTAVISEVYAAIRFSLVRRFILEDLPAGTSLFWNGCTFRHSLTMITAFILPARSM